MRCGNQEQFEWKTQNAYVVFGRVLHAVSEPCEKTTDLALKENDRSAYTDITLKYKLPVFV